MKMRHAVTGSTLIEVLVALLVACLGLLGMVRLSAAAIGHEKSAQLRLTGLTLARQYAEHARLNVYGFDLGAYRLALDEAPPDPPALDADADDLLAARSVAEVDRAAFVRAVALALPEGRVRVDSTPTDTARNLDVWLLWRDIAMDPNDSLDVAATQQCPQDLEDSDRKGARCMHFRVGL